LLRSVYAPQILIFYDGTTNLLGDLQFLRRSRCTQRWVFFNLFERIRIMNAITQLFSTRAVKLALACGLALAASTAALAVEIEPADQSKIQVGESQADVRQDLGEPTKVQTYLFAPGSTWLYTMKNQAWCLTRKGASRRCIRSTRSLLGWTKPLPATRRRQIPSTARNPRCSGALHMLLIT
jgi:hypothetical protein